MNSATRRAPATSWIAASWTLRAGIGGTPRPPFSSPGPSRTCAAGGVIRARWTSPQACGWIRPSSSKATTPRRDYPAPLRRIGFRDPQTGKALGFLTNNFTEPALTIAQLYRCRWRIELFFKWLKQHRRSKAFYGTSDNALRIEVWGAISVYLLVAILKKRLRRPASLDTILQVLSVTLFEKTPILQALAQSPPPTTPPDPENQPDLPVVLTGQ